ncbi:MAG: hypothetical protein P1T08_01290 [Acidimicrobiia bacterium]|nr:hypothetical protein [Acidimicrobiia bacterium]
MTSSRDEMAALRERFGTGIEVIFDGPPESCPTCDHAIEQLTLALDLSGLDPLTCAGCGAVLAA